MRAHLPAAYFVNESSPMIDSFPLHLAIVQRHWSPHRVLRSSHPWRGSVAYVSNFFPRAPSIRAYLSSHVLPLKNFPLSSVSATWSRVRLQTRFLKPCPLLLCLGESTAPSLAWPALAFVRSEARKNICAINVRLGGKFRTHAYKYPRYALVQV